MLLEINNLHVSIKNKEILKGVNLNINAGEIHTIMGPNGSGKSTLSYVLSGINNYQITKGKILFNNKNLLDLNTVERATAGIFLSFQYPIEIPGVSNTQFLKTSVNSLKKARDEKELNAVNFIKTLRQNAKTLGMHQNILTRGVNEGFSGGEKKRNEMLQMLMLEPQLCILDETDSGLDIDALKIVSNSINSMRSKRRSFIIITHYQRLLDHIEPDFVHVLSRGKIIKSGDKRLALALEEKGYSWAKV